MSSPTDSDRATAERLVDGPELQPTIWGIGSRERYINAIAAALAAEREACAKVVEAFGGDNASLGQKMLFIRVSAAIRARSNPNEEK